MINALRRYWPSLIHRQGPLTDQLKLTKSPLLPARLPLVSVPDSTTTIVCGFCSTGCGLNVHLKDGRSIGVSPAENYPVNLGTACPKGWEALKVLDSNERGLQPFKRHASGQPVTLSWTQAMTEFSENFKRIQQQHGPQSIAFISTGQIASEEMFFLGCLAKFGMGMLHGDGNTRQCMATSVAAYKQAFGFDAPPFTYADLEESDVLVFIGANPCIAHPILWQRVMRNRHQPEIIVIDPRCTETAMAASEHLGLRPKSDLTLLYGLANLLIQHDWIDHEFVAHHTEGFLEFARHVAAFDVECVSRETGLPIEQLERVAKKIGTGKRVSLWWTMGVNQSHQGVVTAQAIINLSLMTGNIGRPGTGANSITGQCNAMGSRLFSNTTNLVGHHDFNSPADRSKIAQILDIPVEQIPQQNSWAYDQILSGIGSGEIRGLWIVATNTAHSWIDSLRARKLLDKLEYLVVQDMYATTETVAFADLYLPAAAWGEKEGTLINSERRVGVMRAVSPAPGDAKSDFEIFRMVAEKWGCTKPFSQWTSPAAVFELMKSVSADQPCDIRGIRDYDMLEQAGGIQWPWTSGDAAQCLASHDSDLHPMSHNRDIVERRLFEDKQFYRVGGRALFMFAAPEAPAEQPDSMYPLWLLTGRGSVSQWHTETRTNKSPILRQLAPKHHTVDVNSADAMTEQLRDGQLVEVVSRRGSAIAQIRITNSVSRGQVFMSMHSAQTNCLTLECVDPVSRQPSYKACAVRIRARS